MTIFTQGRHDTFRKFAAHAKKMKVKKDTSKDALKMDSIVKSKKRAMAMATRMKLDDSSDSITPSQGDEEEDEGIEHTSVRKRMALVKLWTILVKFGQSFWFGHSCDPLWNKQGKNRLLLMGHIIVSHTRKYYCIYPNLFAR